MPLTPGYTRTSLTNILSDLTTACGSRSQCEFAWASDALWVFFGGDMSNIFTRSLGYWWCWIGTGLKNWTNEHFREKKVFLILLRGWSTSLDQSCNCVDWNALLFQCSFHCSSSDLLFDLRIYCSASDHVQKNKPNRVSCLKSSSASLSNFHDVPHHHGWVVIRMMQSWIRWHCSAALTMIRLGLQFSGPTDCEEPSALLVI